MAHDMPLADLECVIDDTISNLVIKPVTHRAFTPRECPIVQDIDWEIADILSRNKHLTVEEIGIILVDNIPEPALRECRSQLFDTARAIYHERTESSNSPGGEMCTLSLIQRRGQTAITRYSHDLVNLFDYVSGYQADFPKTTLTANSKIIPAVQQTDETRLPALNEAADDTPHSEAVLNMLSELDLRRSDHDRAIVNMRCSLDSALGELSTIKEHIVNGHANLDRSSNSPKDTDSVYSRNSPTDLLFCSLNDGPVSPSNHVADVTSINTSLGSCTLLDDLNVSTSSYNASDDDAPTPSSNNSLCFSSPASLTELLRSTTAPPTEQPETCCFESNVKPIAHPFESCGDNDITMSQPDPIYITGDIRHSQSYQDPRHNIDDCDKNSNHQPELKSILQDFAVHDTDTSFQLAAKIENKIVVDRDLYYSLHDSVNQLLADMYAIKESYAELEARVNMIDFACVHADDDRTKSVISDDLNAIPNIYEDPRAIVQPKRDGRNDSDSAVHPPIYTSVPNVPCQNRFSVLLTDDAVTNTDDAMHTDAAADDAHQDRRPQNGREAPSKWSKVLGKKKRRHQASRHDPSALPGSRAKTRVSIVGSSIVRGLGSLLNNKQHDVCCYTNPGCAAEHIAARLTCMTSDDDEVIVLAAGTNNVTKDSVATTITHVGKLIDQSLQLRPRAQVVVNEIPHRYDDSNLNGKIDKINVFIRHKCRKTENLHCLRNTFRRGDYKDGLHFNEQGLAKFASNIQDRIRDISFGTR